MYSVSQKTAQFMIITSTNVDRFTKYFHGQIPQEILYTYTS